MFVIVTGSIHHDKIVLLNTHNVPGNALSGYEISLMKSNSSYMRLMK